MNIAFVYKGRYQIRDAVVLEYLSAIAKKYGHATHLVYDQDIFGVTDNVVCIPRLNRLFSKVSRTMHALFRKRPEAVVFLDGFQRAAWNREVAQRVRESKPDLIRVCLSYWDQQDAADTYDHRLIGEPEHVWEGFLKQQALGVEKGVYRSEGLADLDSLPPADKDLFAPYVSFKGSYLIYTSKGCPYQCSYCEEAVYKNRFKDVYFRRRSPANVIGELELAKERFGMREVIYKDSVFAWDKGWLKEYLAEYKKRINVPYKCFGKVENFDRETASLLKESRCYCVEFGAQTFNEKLKKDVLKRDEKTESLSRAFSVCDERRLRYDIDHLFGIPGESRADHLASAGIYMGLQYLNRIKCHNLTYYREAPIYEYAPPEIKEDEDYRGDFFSSVSGSKEMREVNRTFQKYFKVLPMLGKRCNQYILNKDRWRLFQYIPSCIITVCMSLRALKNGDKRFLVYLTYYPRKVFQALRGA